MRKYIYELKIKDINFELTSSRMVVLREITEVSKHEYSRSVERISEVMIASTSHDMRTPLNTIINMIRMLEHKVDNPNLLKWLKIAKTSAGLLTFLVDDTLDYYQIKSNKFSLKVSKFTIEEVVENSFDLISIQM